MYIEPFEVDGSAICTTTTFRTYCLNVLFLVQFVQICTCFLLYTLCTFVHESPVNHSVYNYYSRLCITR